MDILGYVKDFVVFKSLVTPQILIFIYWLGALACPIFMFLAYRKAKVNSSFFSSGKGKRAAIIVFVLVILGELVWRMAMEFLLAYFQIRQALM